MSQYIDNQEVLNNVAEWIQVAIDNSSMGLKPNAPRGLGIRRLYEGKSTKVEYHILDNQVRWIQTFSFHGVDEPFSCVMVSIKASIYQTRSTRFRFAEAV